MSLSLISVENLVSQLRQHLSSLSSDFKWSNVLYAIAATSTSALLGYHCYLSSSFSGEAPIRFSFIPLLGHAIEFGKRPIALLQECKRMYGEIFGLVVGGSRLFFITDAHSYDLILSSSKELSWEPFHNLVLNNFFGLSKHVTQNHVINDDLMRSYYSKYIFSDNGLHNLTTRMQEHLIQMIMSTKEGEYDCFQFLNSFVFGASVASLFNKNIAGAPDLIKDFENFDKSLPLALAGISVDNFAAAKKSRCVLANLCATYKDDTSELIRARCVYFEKLITEGKMSESEYGNIQLAMLWASVGNTMPAIFWLYYLVSSHPRVKRCVEEEVERAFSEAKIESPNAEFPILSQAILNRLNYIDACITESLRLSSGSLIMRYVMKPCTLTLSSGKTYKFRQGDQVGICPPLTHLDSDVFANADTFCPDRWVVGNTEAELLASSNGKIPLTKNGKALPSTYAFLPFGGGPTYCPGRRFARNEIKAFLVYLIKYFQVELLDVGVEGSEQNYHGWNQFPGFDNTRAGVGIFPPLKSPKIHIKRK